MTLIDRSDFVVSLCCPATAIRIDRFSRTIREEICIQNEQEQDHNPWQLLVVGVVAVIILVGLTLIIMTVNQAGEQPVSGQ